MTAAPVPPQKPARRWLVVIPVLIAALLLYVATRGVRWDEVGRTLESCRPGYFLLGCLILSFSTALRARRWHILLTVQKPVPYASTFWASVAGALGNNYLPARAGEVVRSVCISSAGGISSSFALATALGERVLDALILSAIGASAMAALGGAPAAFLRAAQVVAAGAVAGVIFIAVLPHCETAFLAAFAKFGRGRRFAATLQRILLQTLEGLRAFHNLGRLCAFVALSVATWLSDATAAVLIGRSISLQLDFLLALFLLAALGLSSGLPSTPGYLGIYQFVAVSVMTPFGFSRSQALAYIIAFQICIYAVVTLWGGIGLWKMRGVLRGLNLFRTAPVAF